MRMALPLPSRSGSRKALALAGAGALVLMAASPGAAAEPVAEASATGLVLTVLDTPTDSGSFSASNDGTRTTESGSQDPLITVLGNQPFINAGTLAQSATATSTATAGRSAACSGLAGDGATLVSVDQGFCLEPGNNAEINAGTFELSDVTIIEAELLAGLDAQVQALLQPLLAALLPAVDGAVQQVLTAIGDPSVVLDLGTVQSQCTATPAAALGDSQLTDAGLSVVLPTIGEVTLVDFPTTVPPNTKAVTDLDVVVAAISDAIETQLANGLGGILAPLGPLVDQVTTTLNANLISILADQLAPVEDNILDITLNKQVSGTSPESITVTALDLRLLPAAADFVDVANIEIGRSFCSAAPRAAAPPTDDPDPTDDPTDPDAPTPAIPTSVPAGEYDAASASTDGAVNGRIATAAVVLLTMLAAVGGTFGFRRVLRG